jgi:WD40 repeat protein
MIARNACLLSLAIFSTAPAVSAQQTAFPAALKEPVLRVEAGGPTAFVTALAFSPDGKRLYAGGFDKTVHVWDWNEKTTEFVASTNAYRVPITPGVGGVINALALSPNGQWLAVAGNGIVRKTAGFGQSGIVASKEKLWSPEDWLDSGTIYVFNTETKAVRLLSGHRGPVLSLAFAPALAAKPPLLLSAAQEWDGKKYIGAARLWDVAETGRAASLGVLTDLPSPEAQSPGLVAWHSGPKVNELRVALAWPAADPKAEGTLYLWDVANKTDSPWQQKAGRYNTALAGHPDRSNSGQGQLVNSSYHDVSGAGNRGSLLLWNVPAAKPPGEVRVLNRYEPTEPYGYYIPRSLAILSSGMDGKPERVAVVLQVEPRESPGRFRYLLQLVDINNAQAVGVSIILWNGANLRPVMAADRQGHYLAVAGNQDNDIQVFSIPELKEGRAKPRQILHNIGASVQYAAFVSKGKERGLIFNEERRHEPGRPPRAPAAGDMIFDIGGRKLIPFNPEDGWRLDAPEPTGWQMEKPMAKIVAPSMDGKPAVVEWSIAIQLDGRETRRIVVGRQLPKAYALLAPVRPSPFRVPILAVASGEFGETLLVLYNAATGEAIRRLTGHVNQITSLAFSADGKFLVSAGQDQTVCVWSLTDLGKVLGQQGGFLRGLAIKQDGTKLVVVDINNATLQEKGIAKGDVLDDLTVGDKLRRPLMARDYYDALWQAKPGTPVTLRFRGRPPVTLTLDQGTDERKPLFSLFLTREDSVEKRKWVGWNPIGPYDSNAAVAERFIGWHRNTGDEKRPTEFVSAAEYRRDDFKQDLLFHLIAKGDTAQALEAWDEAHPPPPPREPDLVLWIEESGRGPKLDNRGRLQVRERSLTLLLGVLGELPAARITGVDWEVEGLDKGTFKQIGKGEWSVDLSGLPWKRGDYRVTARMRTLDRIARVYQPKGLTLVYRPKAPVIAYQGEKVLTVDEEAFTLRADVRPGEKDQPLKVTLLHQHDNKTVVDRELKPGEVPAVNIPVQLKPGDNVIRLLALNKDVPVGQEKDEQAWVAIHINYKKASLPQIVLKAVVPLAGQPELAIEPGRAVVVDEPKFRIVGDMEATENLVKADWAADDGRPASLNKFVDGQEKKWKIDQEVSVPNPEKPRKFRFLAKTKSSDEAAREVVVEYHPRLPQIRLTTPGDGEQFREGRKDGNRVSLAATLGWPEDRYPCRAEVLINNKSQGMGRVVDVKSETFVFPIDLLAGNNEIQVQLTNPWRETTSEKISVSYRRPPRILRLEQQAKKNEKVLLTDLVADIQTPEGLPLVRARLNGVELPDDVLSAPKISLGVASYSLLIPDRGLQVGESEFKLLASNADGDSDEKSLKIVVRKEELPKPVIQFIEPEENITWREPSCKVTFRVISSTPIERIELLRGDRVLYSAADMGKQPKNEVGEYKIEPPPQEIALERGANSLRVVAANGGGEVSSAVVVNYKPRPVRLVLDYLQVGTKKVELEGGVAKTPKARAVLVGRLIWEREPDSERLVEGIQELLVCVNGRQQFPAKLEKTVSSGEGERTFRKEIVLTQEENVIAIQLPIELPEPADSQGECRVSCLNPEPEPEQRLHLLIVDAMNRNPQEAQKRVFDAIQAQANPVSAEEFTLPGFAKGRLYDVLTGPRAGRNGVLTAILEIHREIELLKASNDVLVVYYHGWEAPDARDHFLGSSKDPNRISFRYVTDSVKYTLGAQVWLLDAVREPPPPPRQFSPAETEDQVHRWHFDPHFSLMRFSWRGEPNVRGPDSWLLFDLKTGLERARKLREVTRHIDSQFTEAKRVPWASRRYKGLLTYDRHLPAGLGELRLGSGK